VNARGFKKLARRMQLGSRYHDRHDAGRVLGQALGKYAREPDQIVLALPRGGVPVGYEVAAALGAPLDVFVVRKLGVPGQEELAMGAIASGGVRVLNWKTIRELDVPKDAVESVTQTEQRELQRREHAYRGDRPPLDVAGRRVILVDDGLATGATMIAAVQGIRKLAPARVVVGVPVADPATCEQLGEHVDDIVCATTPEPLVAVGFWYAEFDQTTDEEVRELLDAAREEQRRSAQGSSSSQIFR
jgi:putative phosphoribosyl transferase